MKNGRLPSVEGRQLPGSLAEFERKCLALIDEQQRSLSPDSALIGLLCDAVRLGREFADRER